MEKGKVLKVLVVEDEPEVAGNIKKLLEKRFDVLVETTTSLRTGKELIESGDFDVVTLDKQLPDGDGISLLEEIEASGEHPPVIIITGHGDEQTAVRAFELGAAGYVVKDVRLHAMLPDVFEKVLSGITLDRIKLELADSLRQLELVADTAPMLIARVDRDHSYLYVNKKYAEFFGRPQDDFKGLHAADVLGDEQYGRLLPYIEEVLRGAGVEYASDAYDNAGRLHHFEVSMVPRFDEEGTVTDYFAFCVEAGRL